MSKEIFLKAKKCTTEKELLALAQEIDVVLTTKQAKELLTRLSKAGEIAEEELENVAGGGCSAFTMKCPKCNSTNLNLLPKSDMIHMKYECNDCHYHFTHVNHFYE